MNPTIDQISPDILQTIVAQATARGLSVNDYLRNLLGLSNTQPAIADTRQEAQPRNEQMLAILRETHEMLKDMPVRGSTEETLKMIRRARAGEMWGYEPTDTDLED